MRGALRHVLVLVSMVALLALFLRQADWGQVWAAILGANAWDLAGSLVFVVLTYVFRTLRWQYMLRPIKSVAYMPALRATVIGFAASVLLPARAGEVVRPYLLARREHFSATAGFATIILERLFDLVTVVVLFGLFLLTYEPAPSVDPTTLQFVKTGVALTAVASLGALVFGFAVAGRHAAIEVWEQRISRLISARAAHALGGLLNRFIHGFAILRSPKAFAMTCALSLPVWFAIAGGIWLVTRAFHLDVPFMGTFLVMTLLVVGVAVPTPGAVGGFHKAYQVATTSFYDAPNDVAIGAAIVLHAMSFGPVVLAGVVFMAHEGLSFGRMKDLAEQGRKESESGEAVTP